MSGRNPGSSCGPANAQSSGGDQLNDVGTVVDALVSSVGWEMNDAQRKSLERVYLAQPEDTRMDSFGVFPSRSRAIRLAIMGFKSQREVCSFLAGHRLAGPALGRWSL